METLLVLLAGFAFYLFLRINRLKQDIEALYKRLEYLNEAVRQLKGEAPTAPKTDVNTEHAPASAPTPAKPVATASPVAQPVTPPPAPAQPLPQPPRPRIPEPGGAAEWKATQATAAEAKTAPASPTPTPPKKPKPTISWEQQIGARLPVWIGGVALALSGIFLVKYSIDTGLLSPAVRCVLAGALGLALLGGAQWVIARKTVANGERIAQALAGSGIAVLYGALFAGGTVYEFFSPTITFASMAAVTAGAVLLSLRHGPPIAMLGMVGGFVTPMLVGASDPNPAVLFGYLTALSIGLFVVIRRENWWWLAWPIVIACYAWVLIWLAGSGTPGDSVWVGLFLIAVCAITIGFISPPRDAENTAFVWGGVLATSAVAVAFMTFIVIRGDFGLGEWQLYGLLAIGAIVLAAVDQDRYRFLPWITIAPVAALLAVWVTPQTEVFVFVLSAFAFLFAAAGIFMIGRARHPVEWGALACVSMLGFYLLAYARLYDVIDAARILAPGEPIGSWPIWGIVATALATVATLVAGRIAETQTSGQANRQLMLGQFSLTAIALMTAGLLIEVAMDDLPIAMAGLLVAVTFMHARADITALRPGAFALTALFVFLLLPQFAPLIVYAARVIVDGPLPNLILLPPIITSPIIYLGAPALLLGAASWFARRRRDDAFVQALEGFVVFLIAIIGYVLIRRADTPVEQVLMTVTPSGLGAFISQALLVYGMALVAAGQWFKRDALIGAGIVACIIAIARIVFFDIKLPLLAYVTVQLTLGQSVDPSLTSPAAAAPLFHLALPALLLAALASVAREDAKGWISRVCEYTVVAFAGLMTYYLVRHAFNAPEDVFAGEGTYLERGVLTNAFVIVGAAAYVAGSRLGREALRIGGAIAAIFAALRLGFFDVLVSSPLVKPHDVGSWPVINALLLPYALPVVWLLLATVALARRGFSQLVPAVHAGAMLLFFALVTLNVRQLFQGPILNNPGLSGDSEVYAYSIAWLILGIGLLVAGTWRHDKLIRFASLAVMVLTVGKVFLYDASELTGLFRVLSFLGLGLSLLGLSWFYTRYVFAPAQAPDKPA